MVPDSKSKSLPGYARNDLGTLEAYEGILMIVQSSSSRIGQSNPDGASYETRTTRESLMISDGDGDGDDDERSRT